MNSAAGALELRDIRGPSAFGGTPRRFLELLWLTSVTEFRVNYANTFLGYLWTILTPLLFFGVIFLVIRQVLRFGENVENYALMLVLGIVFFQYFSSSTMRGVRAISSKEGMIRKARFPRIVLPLSVSLTGSFTLVLNLVAVLPLFLISGLTPRWSWLLLIGVLLLLVLLTTGLTMVLSIGYVRSEDTAQGWSLFSRMMFYAAPILYPIELVPDSFRWLVAINPLSPLLIQARVWVVDADAPNAVEASGVLAGLVIPLALLFAIAAFGLWWFARWAPRVAEDL